MALPSPGQRLTYPKFFVLVTASSMIVRSVLSSFLAGIGGQQNPLFFTAQDIFADCIQSGLAIRAVTIRILNDPRVHAWPALFQSYLFHNSYLDHHISIYHSAPLGLLLLMLFAEVMSIASPVALLIVLAVVYCLGAIIVVRALDAADIHEWPFRALLLIICYPALFMLDRGNFHSGFTSLCILFYAISVVTGRGRGAGMLALAIAVNLRPNTATLLLVELAASGNLRATVRSVVAVTATIGAVALASYIVTTRVDPNYSVATFLHALTLYNTAYVSEGDGMLWNASLLALSRWLQHFGALPAGVLAVDQKIVAVAMLLMCAVSSALAVARRIGLVEAVFLGCALSVLATPILGEYHVLVFATPLILAASGLGGPDRRTIVAYGAPLLALLLLCQILEAWPSQVMAILVAVLAFACPLVWMRGTRPHGLRPGSCVPVIVPVSLFCLCPLGGAQTLGIVIPAMLFSASLCVLLQAFAGPSRTVADHAPHMTSAWSPTRG